jgi:L-lactate dehydrogenase complex protein LldG
MAQSNNARASILQSIREHLTASEIHDRREAAIHHAPPPVFEVLSDDDAPVSLVEMFCESLRLVDGHCIIADGEQEVVRALQQVIVDLQQTGLGCKRIAISEQPVVERLVHQIDADVDELAVTPSAADLFHFDVGISTVQAAIAETGTLVLDSSRERHRLISLVPPVHIAILEAANIRQTLGETLAMLRQGSVDISPVITFVTGPSRTADIELTLAIGVHGPQELYVIINTGKNVSTDFTG